MLQKQLSMGLNITLVILAIFVVHSVSSIAGNLGLVSDVFILLGLIQSIRFATDKAIREELINSFNNFINIQDLKNAVNKFIAFLKDEIHIDDIEDTSIQSFFESSDINNIEDYELKDEDEIINLSDVLNTDPLE